MFHNPLNSLTISIDLEQITQEIIVLIVLGHSVS